jgi:hypothetical protein
MTVKSITLLNVMSYSLIVHGCYGGIYCFHLHGITENQASKQQRVCLLCLLIIPGDGGEIFRNFFARCYFDSEDGGRMFLRNFCELLPDYTALHSRNLYFFIFTTLVNPRFNIHLVQRVSRDSAVGIATGYGLDD